VLATGSEVATYCAKYMAERLKTAGKYATDPKTALLEAFLDMDRELLTDEVGADFNLTRCKVFTSC
jgi:hypothetical protein